MSKPTEHILTVNGERLAVYPLEDEPLLWVLREQLYLTGTKYGCGAGLCGACTVLINKRAKRSCQVIAKQLSESDQILTIEGVAGIDEHPVLEAWMAERVTQCGFCQPGQIMSATGLLLKNHKPDTTQIRQGMSGNLCRCGTYFRIQKAVEKAADSIATEQDHQQFIKWHE